MIDKRFKHIIFNYSDNDIETEIHDYYKLKFEDHELTDYEFLLWVKMFYYMKRKEECSDQIPSHELLDSLRKEYQLPIPTDNPDSEELFKKIISHEWIKLQDSTGKYLFGPFSTTYTQVPSFSINRFQRSLHITIGHLRKQIGSGDITTELKEKTRWIIDCIRGVNHFISTFIINVYASQEKRLPQGDLLEYSYPYSSCDKVSREIYEIIMPICEVPQSDWEKDGYDEELRMPLLLPKLIELKGIAGFSCLSGFFLDAMFISFDYFKPLMGILFFIHSQFHNSILWRIEFAASPVNLAIPVEIRGQQDHTTQLKIYLFDCKDRPRVIRVDMPHKGEGNEKYFHFNVNPVFTGEQFDHKVITKDCNHIQSVLESIREAMSRECFNLFEIKDSDADADDDILNEMQRFLVYEDMTTAYIIKDDVEDSLNRYNIIAQTDFSTINEALEDAYLAFYSKF